MKYRDHRGGLGESMATQREVNSLEELTKHLVGIWGEIEGIEFSYCCFDDRNGWDTYNVCIKQSHYPDYFAVGQSDGKFN